MASPYYQSTLPAAPTQVQVLSSTQAQGSAQAAQKRLQDLLNRAHQDPRGIESGGLLDKEIQKAMAESNAAGATATGARAATAGPSQADRAWDQTMKMTAGQADSIMGDPRIEAALSKLQGGLEGPYTPGVTQQLINRNADSSAYAEGQNADELRNQMAARGTGPNDPGYQAALRQMQSQRQASNLAFAGDTQSKATLANYTAGQQAAQSLAGTKLNQFQTAQAPLAQAANYNANRSFSDGHTEFTGSPGSMGIPTGGNGNLAFSGPPQVNTNAWGTQPQGGGSTPAPAPKPAVSGTSAANSIPAYGTPAYTTWYQQRYGAKAQPGMSGTSRDADGNLINPTPMGGASTAASGGGGYDDIYNPAQPGAKRLAFGY